MMRKGTYEEDRAKAMHREGGYHCESQIICVVTLKKCHYEEMET